MQIKKKTINKSKTSNQGYTLIEVVIAMTISAVAFIAIYALFSKSMQSDTESRYEIVAAGLSQEGIEIIKNKREKNEMDWAMWNLADDGATLPNSFVDISGLHGRNPEINLMPGQTLGDVNWVDNDMQYNTVSEKYEAGCNSNCVGPTFVRECTTVGDDTTGDGDEDLLQVVCTVKWKSLLLGGAERIAKTEIILTDWQK